MFKNYTALELENYVVHKKKNFTEVSKNLFGPRFESNFVGPSK